MRGWEDEVMEDIDMEMKAQRAHELELERRRALVTKERRDFILLVLFGLAVVSVILAAIGAIWNYNVQSDQRDVDRARENTKQVQICTDTGGTWINGNTCVPNREAK